jgi:DNA-binding response OmpR family regulator
VLVIAPGSPPATAGPGIGGEGLQLEVVASPSHALRKGQSKAYDLLVLANMSAEEQNDLATRFQGNRRWRLVPVLFVLPATGRGIVVPGAFRPDIDGLVRGELLSREVLGRIRALAREGAGAAEILSAGAVELDPRRLRLRLGEVEVAVTEREAAVLSILLAQPNRMVTTRELISRGWGVGIDTRSLQILRRHMSNIRRKLDGTPAARSVHTVRGAGYRFDVRLAS